MTKRLPPEEKRDCGAKTRKPGNPPCIKPPSKGATRCRMHGGASPWAKIKAKERDLESEARKTLAQLDIEPVDNPLTELSKVAGQILAWKNLMAGHVEELNGQLRYSGENGEYIRGEILLFERSMDRCVQVLGLIAKLNIDERLAAIGEAQAAMVERAMLAALQELSVPADQQQQALRVMGRHLRVVS